MSNQEEEVARKTVFVSDLSGKAIQDGKAARISINFQDARKGTYVLDVTEEEGEELGRKGAKQARRGRKPKART
jgi:nitrous oxide reductase accessory protein NosL